MKRYNLLWILCLLSFLYVGARPITKSAAENIARGFMSKRCSKSASLACLPHKSAVKGSSGDVAPYYIFNIGNREGFVIVSGDDNAEPVLGYSDRGELDLDNMPANMVEWLRLNELYVENCAKRESSAVGTSRTGNGTVVVEPLLDDIMWGQDFPFNEMCPTYYSGGQNLHYYVGCVATAATQIMRYYRYPQQGTGSKSYVFKGQTLSADFGNTTYDWDNMLAFYPSDGVSQEQIDAAATLAYHFGVSVEMEYAENGSGALSMLVPHALKTYFGYDKATTMRRRNFYSATEWLELIKHELDNNRPVYYGATSDSGLGGHAFVCDGYDSEGYVHINWGWYGMSNGYFLVNHLNPDDLGEGGGTGGYNTDQEIITGIQPSTGGTTDFDRPLYGLLSLKCSDYGSDFTLMSSVNNYDVTPFDGQIAAVVTRDGQIIDILKTDGESTHIDGFANSMSGLYFLTMRDIPTTVSEGIADGACEVRLAFKEADEDRWQFLRHENRERGYVAANIVDGVLDLDEDAAPVPDVTVVGQIQNDGDIFAGGSALFSVTLQNNSSNFNLKNVVVRFRSKDDASKVWDYENTVNIYDGSTESVKLLVNLADDMPSGDYDIILFEKGYPDNPFVQTTPEVASLTVLPAVSVPVMRQTQNLGLVIGATDGLVRQGDDIMLKVTARNYGAAGNVSVILWMENMDNPEQTYLFLQSNVTVDKGKEVTVPLFRKLPVDPGTYRLKLTYLTDDGNETPDINTAGFNNTLTVHENNKDIMLEAVSLDMPDVLYTEEKSPCKIVLRAPETFSGTVYLRLRQYTNTNGEIVSMSSVKMEAGETKEIAFDYKPRVKPERYMLLVEAKQGGVTGTVASYHNCYKLVEVKSGTSDISSVDAQNDNANVYYKDGRVYVDVADGSSLLKTELIAANGALVTSCDKASMTGGWFAVDVQPGVYMVKVTTDKGVSVRKIMIK